MMDERIWLEEISKKITEKMFCVVERNRDKIPYTAKEGHYVDRSHHIGWWTNGFWGGILWQLYHATGEEMYRKEAEALEKKQDKNLMYSPDMDHDNGFRWLPTAVANYRLNKNVESKNRAILVADNLAGRFNLAGNFIRAWNWGDYPSEKAGWAIIDCMMNLPLLYWAYEEDKDPRYLHIAKAHADTVIKHFVREDGSVKHIVEFDPETGAYIGSRAGQGYAHGSSWTRGQSWAIYGFTLSYMHTKEERYLETAKKVAKYFLSQLDESYLVPVDFRQPKEPKWEDSTAAAVTACGLIELSRVCAGDEKEYYHSSATKLLHALVKHRADWSIDTDPILSHCAEAYHSGVDINHMMYADYYFIEAIWKLTGKELFIW